MKKLTIGLPTYNREKQILKLMDFLYNEFSDLSQEDRNKIDIYVSDNCSTDDTERKIKDSKLYKSNLVDIHYTRNESNLGLLGNLKKLYTTAKGEYLWLMGDDDDYKKTIVKKVYEECCKNEYSYIFINHTTFKDGVVIDQSVIGRLDSGRMDKSLLWDLYKQSGTVMMFMSACIYKMEHTKELVLHDGVNLVSPCTLSFYCASKGKVKVIEEALILNDWTNISWRKMSFRIFFIEIPQMLLKMPSWGYDRLSCYAKIVSIMWHGRRCIVRHILKLVR